MSCHTSPPNWHKKKNATCRPPGLHRDGKRCAAWAARRSDNVLAVNKESPPSPLLGALLARWQLRQIWSRRHFILRMRRQKSLVLVSWLKYCLPVKSLMTIFRICASARFVLVGESTVPDGNGVYSSKRKLTDVGMAIFLHWARCRMPWPLNVPRQPLLAASFAPPFVHLRDHLISSPFFFFCCKRNAF